MRRFWSCLFVLGLLVAAATPSASAATFVVTNTNDSGVGSLRGAIQAARTADGPDTVTFELTGCPCTITLTSGYISLLDPLTIEGPGADLLAVSGNDSSRVFRVESTELVAIDGLTIRNGRASQASGAPFGGAIFNTGTLTITNSTISNNRAIDSSGGASGGAIVSYGTLTIADSTITGNSARAGGAIFNIPGATLTVANTTISGNSAGYGGGIYNSRDGTLTVTDSTFSGNSVTEDGGGLYNDQGTATVTNSTFDANSAKFGGGMDNLAGTLTVRSSTLSGNDAVIGGGIHNFAGTLTVISSTVTGNSAQTSFGGGGGINGRKTIRNSLIAGNTTPPGGNPDLSGPVSDGGYNLIGDGRGSGLTHGVNGNLVGTASAPIDPRLGPLTDNGGPTVTHALLAGSPAIDHIPVGTNGCGDPHGADQRGVTRPRGTGCDIGAYELIQNRAPAVTIAQPADNAVLAAGPIALAAAFTDPDPGDTHTCELVLSDGDDATPDPAFAGAVTEPAAQPGSCTATQELGAGVYTLTATVTDAAGASGSDTTMLVVYDPSAGFVTGGGWITSHPGDCTLDPECAAAVGKATFAFVARYKKGASIPTGSTRLHFAAGGLTFHSESYDWLIVNQSGTNARYKGTGTVNGANDPDGNPYKFMVWARDGADDGIPDTFRIKIWSEGSHPDTNEPVENVVYDNAAATTPDEIAAGSIMIKTN